MERDHKTDSGGWIETYTGKQFWFNRPEVHMIDVIDIAHSLSMQCRYTGHIKKFYSVAEHCCLLHDYYLRENGFEKAANQIAFELLMHDASEAYLTDVPRPIKPYIPEYLVIEKKIEKVIGEKYNLTHPHNATIKMLDARILMDERAQAMSESGHDWQLDLEPLDVQLRFWNPARAEAEYISRFNMRRLNNVNPKEEQVLAPCDSGE